MTNPIPHLRKFYDETIEEIKKCTWPTFAELYESTLVVIYTMLIITLFIWVFDQISQYFIRTLIMS